MGNNLLTVIVDMVCAVMRTKNLSQIKPEQVDRLSWTYAEMDWAYGTVGSWGFPRGRISLWSGEPGVGKSRLLAEIMKRLAERGERSLIFQGEVSAEQFASEKFKGVSSANIFLSEAKKVDEICEGIKEVKPSLVFIDSFQMIRDERVRAKSFGMKPIEYIIECLRQSLVEVGAHMVLISQLNKSGKTKGSNDLPHLVDIECYLQKYAVEFTRGGLFEFIINKNRYGSSGRSVIFGHKDWGVECQSQHRLQDPEWLTQEEQEELDELVFVDKVGPVDVVEKVVKPFPRNRRSLMSWILGTDD